MVPDQKTICMCCCSGSVGLWLDTSVDAATTSRLLSVSHEGLQHFLRREAKWCGQRVNVCLTQREEKQEKRDKWTRSGELSPSLPLTVSSVWHQFVFLHRPHLNERWLVATCASFFKPSVWRFLINKFKGQWINKSQPHTEGGSQNKKTMVGCGGERAELGGGRQDDWCGFRDSDSQSEAHLLYVSVCWQKHHTSIVSDLLPTHVMEKQQQREIHYLSGYNTGLYCSKALSFHYQHLCTGRKTQNAWRRLLLFSWKWSEQAEGWTTSNTSAGLEQKLGLKAPTIITTETHWR